jgi:hypothetical protein
MRAHDEVNFEQNAKFLSKYLTTQKKMSDFCASPGAPTRTIIKKQFVQA